MSAVFSIKLLLKEQLTIPEIVSFIKKENTNCEIDLIETHDDWEFSNEKRLSVGQIEDCDSLIRQGKMVRIYGVLESLFQFSMFLYKPAQTIYATSFGISTKGIEMLDNDYITQDNKEVYSFITNKITTTINKDILLVGAIGSELTLFYESSFEDILKESYGACEWIFPDEKPYSYLDKYSKSQVNGFTIYCLKA